ncbi:hypothetical protein NVP1081O_066 [Vibrio phage 1.081.O._10N.286.52.C2]|nr:hypothetical protein NVP1081O_066 [Vibrio phage 1.081.O._10N.286.52.C2]
MNTVDFILRDLANKHQNSSGYIKGMPVDLFAFKLVDGHITGCDIKGTIEKICNSIMKYTGEDYETTREWFRTADSEQWFGDEFEVNGDTYLSFFCRYEIPQEHLLPQYIGKL